MIDLENCYGIVYKIENQINGKKYFGQTTKKPPEIRWSGHKCSVKNGNLGYFYNSIRKYGINNFKFERVCVCGDALSLGLMEDLCIVLYESMKPNGYNLKRGGMNRKLSEETKKKIGDANRGRKIIFSEEHKNNLSKAS